MTLITPFSTPPVTPVFAGNTSLKKDLKERKLSADEFKKLANGNGFYAIAGLETPMDVRQVVEVIDSTRGGATDGCTVRYQPYRLQKGHYQKVGPQSSETAYIPTKRFFALSGTAQSMLPKAR